jgi:hypothetical protein
MIWTEIVGIVGNSRRSRDELLGSRGDGLDVSSAPYAREGVNEVGGEVGSEVGHLGLLSALCSLFWSLFSRFVYLSATACSSPPTTSEISVIKLRRFLRVFRVRKASCRVGSKEEL